MNTIELKNTLPAVFAGREKNESEVWLQNLTFEKGKHYLISAESGTGKSSMCSYIYGYDLNGNITSLTRHGVNVKVNVSDVSALINLILGIK